MNTLPEEIVTKILIYSIDYKIQNGIHNLNNIKLINKPIYSIINTNNFWIKLYKFYDMLDFYKQNSTLNHIKAVIDYNMLKYKVPKELVDIFTIKYIYSLPFIKQRLYICDKLYYDVGYFTHSIMRGYDSNNNFIISFKYKSLIDQQNLVEIIYLSVENDYRKIWTTCGSGNSIYCSNFLSKDVNNLVPPRYTGIPSPDLILFNTVSKDYIKRILNGNAGLIYETYPWGFSEDLINKLILVD